MACFHSQTQRRMIQSYINIAVSFSLPCTFFHLFHWFRFWPLGGLQNGLSLQTPKIFLSKENIKILLTWARNVHIQTLEKSHACFKKLACADSKVGGSKVLDPPVENKWYNPSLPQEEIKPPGSREADTLLCKIRS